MTSTITLGEVPAFCIISNVRLHLPILFWYSVIAWSFCRLVVACSRAFFCAFPFSSSIRALWILISLFRHSFSWVKLFSESSWWKVCFLVGNPWAIRSYSLAWDMVGSRTFLRWSHDWMALFWFAKFASKESIRHSFRVRSSSVHPNWRVTLIGEYLSTPWNPNRSKGFLFGSQIIASPTSWFSTQLICLQFLQVRIPFFPAQKRSQIILLRCAQIKSS